MGSGSGAVSGRRPDVTARTTVAGGRTRVTFTSTAGASLSVAMRPPDVLRAACGRFGGNLDRICARYRSSPAAPAARAGKSLNDLAGLGLRFLFDALDDPHDDPFRLARFLRQACPAWRDRRTEAPQIYTIARADQFLPWELLPLFDPAAVIRVQDQQQLEQAALCFSGFAAIVERSDPEFVNDGPDLNGWDRLPVRMAYDASYEGAQQEVGFFRGKGNYVRLEGPYPGDLDNGDAPTLAQQLCDPRLGVDGTRGVPADQILHLACHCDTSGTDTDGYTYRLSAGDRRLLIRLGELKEELMRHWAVAAIQRPGGGRPQRPLVFLNACGTAAMDPGSAVSLLQPFQKNHNRGVIGTAANVPDRTAAEIGRWFYTSLLAGTTVGEALHAAKWRLLHDRGNPLGLLYSLHACAQMRIAPLPTRVLGGVLDGNGSNGKAPHEEADAQRLARDSRCLRPTARVAARDPDEPGGRGDLR